MLPLPRLLCSFCLLAVLVLTLPRHCLAEPEKLSWETGAGKSYLIPALEMPSFVVLLNIFDRLAFPDKRKEGKRAYVTNPSTTWEHLRKQNWHYDKDTFEVNQFGHPYQGSAMYGLARSAGLDFWTSLLYSNAGSFLWEMAGETSRPATNDMITTGNAGSLLGEALFRMAGLVLEEGGPHPAQKYEMAAALISPTTAVNRLAFGDRFDAVFPSHKPANLWQVTVGGSYRFHGTDSASADATSEANAVAGFAMAYGLPGKPGYSYTRPLDYFDFQIAGRTEAHNILQAVTLRGLLLGSPYHRGEDLRGIWGLYGSYDYLSPGLFRVSTTGISLGTTAQGWVAPGVALQGSFLGGVGFGTGGVEAEIQDAENRVHHYGASPQGLLSLRLIFGDRTAIDLEGRGYYITASNLDQLIVTGGAGATVRLTGHHGVTLRYDAALWEPQETRRSERQLTQGTVSLAYTFLSDPDLGAVRWGDEAVQ